MHFHIEKSMCLVILISFFFGVAVTSFYMRFRSYFKTEICCHGGNASPTGQKKEQRDRSEYFAWIDESDCCAI